jgi:hypothetical protein
MPANQRRTNEEIIAAYRDTGSVWRAAKALGLCGQSVWERLKRIGYMLPSEMWTTEEMEELRVLASHCTISEIARRLNRTYASVASMASSNGIAMRHGATMKRKVPRRGISDEEVRVAIASLRDTDMSITPFSRSIGHPVERLVQAIQNIDLEFWRQYTSTHGIYEKQCVYCHEMFWALSNKQRYCHRKCASFARADLGYFGGRRSETVGLAEGICQLCGADNKKLSSHHELGKEHDGDGDFLVALCNSCHHVVGLLGAKNLDSKKWERLIMFVMARRMRVDSPKSSGVSACVEIEYLTEEEMLEVA